MGAYTRKNYPINSGSVLKGGLFLSLNSNGDWCRVLYIECKGSSVWGIFFIAQREWFYPEGMFSFYVTGCTCKRSAERLTSKVNTKTHTGKALSIEKLRVRVKKESLDLLCDFWSDYSLCFPPKHFSHSKALVVYQPYWKWLVSINNNKKYKFWLHKART